MTTDHLDESPGAAPGWLRQIAGLILGESDDAFRTGWTGQLRDALLRLDGAAPIEVVHHWHANSVSSLLIDSCARRGLPARVHLNLRELHRSAWRGLEVPEDEWRRALEPALRAVYEHSYPHDEAYATAAEAAYRYARLHNYDEDAAQKYRDHYAALNTEAAVRLFAAANAKANSDAYARAYARSDQALLSDAYPGAYLKACVRLARNDSASVAAIYAGLGEGLTESLRLSGPVVSRTPSPARRTGH